MSMGVHHDNFDLWNSKHQPRWNAVATGPKKDIVGLFAAAARKHGLKFAVSEHLSNSYNWLAVSPRRRQDRTARRRPLRRHRSRVRRSVSSVPQGQADPHAGHEPRSSRFLEAALLPPHQDLIDKYKPDLLYTDGGIPFGEWGYKLVSHYYNQVPNGIYTSKTKKDCEEGTCALDIERGVAGDILPNPWQTDTCIGGWHYKKGQKYKSGKNVVDLLCDIVSRNGNLMLNVPLPNSGKPDDEELKTVEEITKWMAVNSEGIYGTRPWKIAGSAAPPAAGNNGIQRAQPQRPHGRRRPLHHQERHALRVRDGMAGARGRDPDPCARRQESGGQDPQRGTARPPRQAEIRAGRAVAARHAAARKAQRARRLFQDRRRLTGQREWPTALP